MNLTKSVHNEQGHNIGHITPCPDEHGNKRTYATSSVTDEEFIFWTESAARFWLDILDERVRGAAMRRGGRHA